jgi:2-desacetyl-2-hydroxyethyl bacteriochlorophyllide A dehydrogenase
MTEAFAAVENQHRNQLINTSVFFKGPYELEYETSNVDNRLGPNEVLMRTEYSLISPGTELALYTGTHVGLPDPNNKFAKYPFYPGYSVVGHVVDTGTEVQDFLPGDKVYTIGKHGVYNTIAYNNEQLPLVKLSDDFTGERAVFARLAAICMTSVINSRIRVGDIAVVMGMGLIGNLAAQLFSIMGANVIGVDVVQQRLQIAGQTGIDNVILSGEDVNVSERVLEITGGKQADIVVEATGSPQLVVPSLELVRPLGQLIALGSTRGNVDLNVYEYIHRKGVHFIGAHEGLQNIEGFTSRSALTRYILKLIGLGALKLEPLLTHKLPFSEAKQGYDMLLNQKDQALGVLLTWNH